MIPSLDSNSNRFATAAESLDDICFRLAIDITDWLSIEQVGYPKNRLDIDGADWLLIEQIGYR